MKNIFTAIIFAVLLQSCIVSSKPNMDFVKKKDCPKGTQIVSINPPLFLAKPFIKKALKEDDDEDSKVMLALIKKIKKVRVMTITIDSTIQSHWMPNVAGYLKKNKYEEWATIKSQGQYVSISAKGNEDVVKDLLIAVNSTTDKVYVHVEGKFSVNDITNMINMAENNSKTAKKEL